MSRPIPQRWQTLAERTLAFSVLAILLLYDFALFVQLDYSTMGILSRNYMQSATRISMILPDTVLIRRSVNRRHAATASW